MPDTARQSTRKPNKNKVEYVKYNTSALMKSVGDLYAKVTGPKKKYGSESKELKRRKNK